MLFAGYLINGCRCASTNPFDCPIVPVAKLIAAADIHGGDATSWSAAKLESRPPGVKLPDIVKHAMYIQAIIPLSFEVRAIQVHNAAALIEVRRVSSDGHRAAGSPADAAVFQVNVLRLAVYEPHPGNRIQLHVFDV